MIAWEVLLASVRMQYVQNVGTRLVARRELGCCDCGLGNRPLVPSMSVLKRGLLSLTYKGN